jgi:hypothetical protein
MNGLAAPGLGARFGRTVALTIGATVAIFAVDPGVDAQPESGPAVDRPWYARYDAWLAHDDAAGLPALRAGRRPVRSAQRVVVDLDDILRSPSPHSR